MKVLRYEDHLLLEKYEKNLKRELKSMGITDKKELKKYLEASKEGHLGHYLKTKGRVFTFGLLYAIFQDAIKAKKRSNIKKGAIKMIHRLAPMALAPFFPIIAIVGYIFGTSRAFNKILSPIISDPGNDYNNFLRKVIDRSMKFAEGEVPIKDRLSSALVVSDDFVSAIKPEVLHQFTLYLSNKMYRMNLDEIVPDHFVENELKSYINKNFNVDPSIPLKEGVNLSEFLYLLKN